MATTRALERKEARERERQQAMAAEAAAAQKLERRADAVRKALEAIIREDGGMKQVAKVCDVPVTTVSMSRAKGHVTPKMAVRLAALRGADLMVLAPQWFEAELDFEESQQGAESNG